MNQTDLDILTAVFPTHLNVSVCKHADWLFGKNLIGQEQGLDLPLELWPFPPDLVVTCVIDVHVENLVQALRQLHRKFRDSCFPWIEMTQENVCCNHPEKRSFYLTWPSNENEDLHAIQEHTWRQGRTSPRSALSWRPCLSFFPLLLPTVDPNHQLWCKMETSELQVAGFIMAELSLSNKAVNVITFVPTPFPFVSSFVQLVSCVSPFIHSLPLSKNCDCTSVFTLHYSFIFLSNLQFNIQIIWEKSQLSKGRLVIHLFFLVISWNIFCHFSTDAWHNVNTTPMWQYKSPGLLLRSRVWRKSTASHRHWQENCK